MKEFVDLVVTLSAGAFWGAVLLLSSAYFLNAIDFRVYKKLFVIIFH